MQLKTKKTKTNYVTVPSCKAVFAFYLVAIFEILLHITYRVKKKHILTRKGKT